LTTAEVCPAGGARFTADGHLITGVSLSNTATMKLQLAEFEDGSVPVQVTEVLPVGKSDPDGGEHCTDATEQLSVTLGAG